MAANLIVQIVSIIIIIGLFALMIFSKRLHYALGGIILLGIGGFIALFEFGIASFDISEYPILLFSAYFFIVLAGKDLLKEGFKEKDSPLKWPSIILGIVLIILTTIPTLNKMHVIEWALPEYPPIIDGALYIICGIFLLIGVFTILADIDGK